MNIIQCLEKVDAPSWSIDTLIKDSIFILNYFEDYYISHVYREGNNLVDAFSNLGVGNCSTQFWYNLREINFNVQTLICYDVQRYRNGEVN